MQKAPIVLVAFALLANSATAQEPALQEPTVQLPETVVTARKREELLLKVPGSVTVVSGAEIERAGLTNIRDASLLVPNLTITEFTSRRLSFPFLRGIGSGQGEPSVVTYVDGVPQLTTGSTNLPLVGLERIEFLRGPQGTLYGRNSLGGVIHMISKRPANQPELGASVELGNFHSQNYGLSWSGPLKEGGAYLSLSGLYSAREGYTENDFTGNDVDDREAWFGRAQLLLTPDERNEIRLGLYGERARDGGFALGDLSSLENRSHRINQDFEGIVERDLLAPSVTWQHFGDSVEFTSITAFTDWDVLETADFDFSPIDGVRRRTVEEQEYFYEELRFASTEESDLAVVDQAAIQWLAGLSVFSAESRRAVDNEFRPGGAGILFPPMNVGVDGNTGNFDDLGLGVFGQATLTLNEDFDFTAGLRYDYEKKDANLRQTFEVGGFPVLNVRREFDEEFDELVPSFSFAWRAAEDLTTYASAAKGFKAGGFNLNAPSGQFSFQPETSWTYELGIKKAWFEERVNAALALFFIDWEDMQLSLFDPAVGGYVDNAGASTSRGVELEADWEVDEHLTLFSGFGYTDTEIDEFVDQFGTNTAGNELPFAPETMWNLGAEYAGALAREMIWYVRGDYVNVGDFAYEPGNNQTESYELANFRIGLRRKGWDASLWARNAFDEEYVPIAFQINPADPTQFVGENGAPATWGVTIRGSF